MVVVNNYLLVVNDIYNHDVQMINKYWGPIKEITDYVCNSIPEGSKVLELGPGNVPLSKATHFCGWLNSEKEKLSNYKIVDFSKDKFPYENKEFDFIYARHVLEDLDNPFNCMDEMSRIAKAGFIECPSPIAEICREVENWNVDQKIKWRGYNHHHNFVWNNGDKLNFLHKFPSVEYMKLNDETFIEKLLEKPINWNTYFMWKDKINYKRYNHPHDYHSPGSNEYYNLILESCDITVEFNKKILK